MGDGEVMSRKRGVRVVDIFFLSLWAGGASEEGPREGPNIPLSAGIMNPVGVVLRYWGVTLASTGHRLSMVSI